MTGPEDRDRTSLADRRSAVGGVLGVVTDVDRMLVDDVLRQTVWEERRLRHLEDGDRDRPPVGPTARKLGGDPGAFDEPTETEEALIDAAWEPTAAAIAPTPEATDRVDDLATLVAAEKEHLSTAETKLTLAYGMDRRAPSHAEWRQRAADDPRYLVDILDFVGVDVGEPEEAGLDLPDHLDDRVGEDESVDDRIEAILEGDDPTDLLQPELREVAETTDRPPDRAPAVVDEPRGEAGIGPEVVDPKGWDHYGDLVEMVRPRFGLSDQKTEAILRVALDRDRIAVPELEDELWVNDIDETLFDAIEDAVETAVSETDREVDGVSVVRGDGAIRVPEIEYERSQREERRASGGYDTERAKLHAAEGRVETVASGDHDTVRSEERERLVDGLPSEGTWVRRHVAGRLANVRGAPERADQFVDGVDRLVAGLAELDDGLPNEREALRAVGRALDTHGVEFDEVAAAMAAEPMGVLEAGGIDHEAFDAASRKRLAELEQHAVDGDGESPWSRWNAFRNVVRAECGAAEVEHAERAAHRVAHERRVREARAAGDPTRRFEPREFSDVAGLVGRLDPAVEVGTDEVDGEEVLRTLVTHAIDGELPADAPERAADLVREAADEIASTASSLGERFSDKLTGDGVDDEPRESTAGEPSRSELEGR